MRSIRNSYGVGIAICTPEDPAAVTFCPQGKYMRPNSSKWSKLVFNLSFMSTILSLIFMPLTGVAISEKNQTSIKSPVQKKVVSGSLRVLTQTNTLSANEIMEVSGVYVGNIIFQLPDWEKRQQRISLLAGYIATYTHELEGDRSGDVIDPMFSYAMVLGDKGVFKKLTLGLGGLIPANKETTNTSMVFTAGPNLEYTFDFGRLTWLQRLSYRQSWFTYDTQPNGKMNNPHTASLANSLDIKLNSNWSLGFVGNLIYTVDYNGVDRSNTEVGGNISWIVAENFSTTLGLITRSGTLAPAGDSHSLNIYDPNRAMAYWELALSF